MAELYFCAKITIMTLMMVVFMQIRVGQYTIEENAYEWIKTSYMVVYLEEVSEGAILAMRDTYRSVSSVMSTKVQKKFSEEFSPGNRSIVPDLERSGSYLKRLNEKMKDIDPDLVTEVKEKASPMKLREALNKIKQDRALLREIEEEL